MLQPELKFVEVPLPAFSNKAMDKIARRSNNNTPSFFRILLQDFAQKLRIPRAFLKHVTNERFSGKTTLVDPNGKSYQVDVYNDDEDKYFGGDGWTEFVGAHNLGLGYFLIFSYRGNMIFDFIAYDLSTFEIAYPSAPLTKRRVSQTLKQKLDRKRTADVQTQKQQADKKMKRPVGRPPKQQEVRTSAPTKTRTCTVQCFQTEIKPLNLARQYVHIPARIMAEFPEMQSQRKIVLKDPDGRSWNVRVHVYQRRTRRVRSQLSAGWGQFARGNNLKMGDKCIFEMVTKGEERGKTMIVKIIRRRGRR